MAILNSLLTAIMRADGDALVLHVGERPYVVTGIGNVDLSKTVLTLEAVSSMLAQLLPADLLETLAEVGAVEHQLQPPSTMRDAFTVVAARGGDDIWIEIRRKRAVVRAPVHVEAPREEAPPAMPEVVVPELAAEGPGLAEPIGVREGAPLRDVSSDRQVHAAPPASVAAARHPAPVEEPPEPAPAPAVVEQTPVIAAQPYGAVDEPQPEPTSLAQADVPAAAQARALEPVSGPEPQIAAVIASEDEEPIVAAAMSPVAEPPAAAGCEAIAPPNVIAEPMAQPTIADEPSAATETPEPESTPTVSEQPNEPEPLQPAASADVPPPAPPRDAPPPFEAPRAVESANVVPLTRVIRVEVPPRTAAKVNTVRRLLAYAVAHSSELLYLTSQSRPFVRSEGEMRVVDNEPVFSAAEIDAILLDIVPEHVRELHARGEATEWTAEFDSIGEIRCATFRDRRGPGLVFQLATARPISAEQLELSRDIQSLATESEGLVIVAGPRGGGKSTLVGAMVDLVNRQHSVSVITIERQVRIVHENHLALVSQREVSGSSADAAAAVRAALRERPDVLVIEDFSSPDIVHLALEAAGTGRLVILTIAAGSTVTALTRVLEAFAPPARKAAQLALAERLRGVVSQVVLRKTGGGRVAARELLLTSSAVATLLADGQIAQLMPSSGVRKPGGHSLNDALATLVKNGTVDAGEAYRKADNRAGLLALLEHDGVDTSLLARLA